MKKILIFGNSKNIWMFLTIIIVLNLSVSCSEDNDIRNEQPGTGGLSKSICFTTEMDDLTSTYGRPVSDAKELTTMGVFCCYTGTSDWNAQSVPNKMFNQKLKYNGTGTWSYENSQDVFWGPTTFTDRYTFFAYAPYAGADNGIDVTSSASTPGIPSLSYDVPTDVTKQPDLMVAVPRYDLRPTGSPVVLDMKHALTSVGFEIKGNGEQITGISVTGVSVDGTVAVDGGNIVWNIGTTTTTDFSASINFDPGENFYTAKPSMSADLMKGDGYLMMIPQKLGQDAKVIIEMADGTKRGISLNSMEWLVGKKVVYHITITPLGTITVTPSSLFLQDAATTKNNIRNFNVICQDNNGQDMPSLNWTLTSGNPTWLTLTTNGDGSGAVPVLSGNGSQTVFVVATKNTGTSARSTDVDVAHSSGATVTKVNVSQFYQTTGPGTTPSGTNFYVGAFWRKNQTGERIIHFKAGNSNVGAWTATVYWMDDRWKEGDIVLSTSELDKTSLINRGITWNYSTENPDDAEKYQVAGSETTVTGTANSGNDMIEFRIGLKSTYTPSAGYPARYAVIMLSYADNSRAYKIFLRQGEDPDYVMKRGKRFSPYNLTIENISGGSNANNHQNYGARKGKFVEYPTQAGALYQWGAVSVSNRKAYHPTNPSTGKITSWNTSKPNNYWNSLSANNETCPSGYRRPQDGDTDKASSGNATNSEMRMSLWVSPQNGNNAGNRNNTIHGYYADGFFDRRDFFNPHNNISSGVERNSYKVAYDGNLVFNPDTNASLFFPSAGSRATGDGNLASAGLYGNYWTSSSYNTSSSWALSSGPSNMTMVMIDRGNAFSIRCVVE